MNNDNQEYEVLMDAEEIASIEADGAADFDVLVSNAAPTAKVYAEEISRYPLLTRDETVELAKKKDAGDKEALDKLVVHNLRLVLKVAGHRYLTLKDSKMVDMPLEDLIQEGTLGLMTAARKYDHTKGFAFSTYAIPWIMETMNRGIGNCGRTIRIPSNKLERISMVMRSQKDLELVLGRVPDSAEICSYLDNKYTVEQIDDLLEIARKSYCYSMQVPMSDKEDDGEMGDFIEDTTIQSPEDFAIESDTKDRIRAALNKLPEKERLVVSLSYGIDCEERTLEDIKQILFEKGFDNHRGECMSRQAVQLIRARALVKLTPMLRGLV